jgi:hypothetical protein
MGGGTPDVDTTPSPEEQQMMQEQARKEKEEEEQRIKLLRRGALGVVSGTAVGGGATQTLG